MKWIRRALVVLLAIPVVAILLLVLAGQRSEAGRTRVRIEIDRPPAQVFHYLENPDRLKEWTGLSEVQMLTPGPLHVGSRARAVAVARGQRTEMETEVTDLEPNRRLSLVLKTTGQPPVGFAQLAQYRLEDLGGRTALSVVADTSYDGFVARLLEPIITPAVQSELARQVARLKAQLEAEPVVSQSDRVPPPGAASQDATSGSAR